MTNEDVGGLFANLDATLLDSGQHGVAGHGTLAVGKTTDADVLRHLEAHALSRIEDADGRVVVDGKEGIGAVFLLQDFGCQGLRIGTVITNAGDAFIIGQTMFQQGVLITVEAVLRDLHRRCRSIETDALAARLYQVRHGIVSSHIVVDNHTTGIHARTYSIIEHQRHTLVHQSLEVVILLRVLGLTDDDATHLILVERLADTHLALILLAALGYHDTIATGRCLFFNA